MESTQFSPPKRVKRGHLSSDYRQKCVNATRDILMSKARKMTILTITMFNENVHTGCTNGLPSPAPLVFTPEPPEKSRCLNCEAEMTPDHQCVVTDNVIDSDWEDIENERDLYPTLDLDSEKLADNFTNSIRRFHESNS